MASVRGSVTVVHHTSITYSQVVLPLTGKTSPPQRLPRTDSAATEKTGPVISTHDPALDTFHLEVAQLGAGAPDLATSDASTRRGVLVLLPLSIQTSTCSAAGCLSLRVWSTDATEYPARRGLRGPGAQDHRNNTRAVHSCGKTEWRNVSKPRVPV